MTMLIVPELNVLQLPGVLLPKLLLLSCQLTRRKHCRISSCWNSAALDSFYLLLYLFKDRQNKNYDSIVLPVAFAISIHQGLKIELAVSLKYIGLYIDIFFCNIANDKFIID